MTMRMYWPVLVLLAIATTAAQGQVGQVHRTISVSGTAEVRVPPDEVRLRLGVESRHAQLAEAVKQNEASTAAVLNFLRQEQLDAKDIQTDFLEIRPQYNHDSREQQVTPAYFQVQRNLGVRLRNVARFDAVLAGALQQGANHVMGIEFRTTELRKHRDAARQQAIRAAKEKALALTRELDATIGKVQTISEQSSGGWLGWSGTPWNQGQMFQNAMQTAPVGGEPSDGNLAVGQISVHATVHVTFELQ